MAAALLGAEGRAFSRQDGKAKEKKWGSREELKKGGDFPTDSSQETTRASCVVMRQSLKSPLNLARPIKETGRQRREPSAC